MNRKFIIWHLFAFVLASLVPGPATAETLTPAAATAPVSPDEDSLYAKGTRAMNENRWADAVISFEQVVNAMGNKADAALYWKAYSLNKLGKRQLAEATCVQLRTKFHESTWNQDCRALALSFRSDQYFATPPNRDPSQGDFTSPSINSNDPDADLKILALNSMLHRDPAKAISVLRGMLTGDQPASIKQHAMFVLAESQSPEAQALMHDMVIGKMGLELQHQSIQAVGVYQGKRANDTLAEVYRQTLDLQIKQAIIAAFFISQDDARLVELARSEKDIELKRAIVSQLALMQGKAATDYMMELLK